MRHKLFHCWDCGERVIVDNGQGKFKPAPTLQQVRFKLSNGAYMVNPFCDPCSERPWDRDRLNALKQAIVEVMPGFSDVTITACEGPISLIAGVAR